MSSILFSLDLISHVQFTITVQLIQTSSKDLQFILIQGVGTNKILEPSVITYSFTLLFYRRIRQPSRIFLTMRPNWHQMLSVAVLDIKGNSHGGSNLDLRFSRQIRRKSSEYNIATYPSHILNNGIILNMSTPHMPLFQIGVTFFEYAVWIYSGMSAVFGKDVEWHKSNSKN
jgi:hypothetical protein